MLAEFGLTRGELTIVVFVVVTVLSARFWPRMGERIATKLSRSLAPERRREP